MTDSRTDYAPVFAARERVAAAKTAMMAAVEDLDRALAATPPIGPTALGALLGISPSAARDLLRRAEARDHGNRARRRPPRPCRATASTSSGAPA